MTFLAFAAALSILVAGAVLYAVISPELARAAGVIINR